jgi:hypothetical protein
MDISDKLFTNIFPLNISPYPQNLFKGDRMNFLQNHNVPIVSRGKYAYSLIQTKHLNEATRVELSILKDLVLHSIKSTLLKSPNFFDVSAYSLSASIAKDYLYREEVFSVIRAFELQLLYTTDSLYVAINPTYKVYSRLPLPEILSKLGENSISLPQRCLCYSGESGKERWRDARILGFRDTDKSVVHVPSLEHPEIIVSNKRIIPKLPIVHIKRLLRLYHSTTQIEAKLIKLRKQNFKSEGEAHFNLTQSLLKKVLMLLGDISFGEHSISIGAVPTPLNEFDSKIIDTPSYSCLSRIGGKPIKFDNIQTGLKSIRVPKERVRNCPVVIFCTEQTRAPMLEMVEKLNSGRKTLFSFKGLNTHFGIHLSLVPDGVFIASSPEDYIKFAKDLTIDPDPAKASSIVLAYLSEDDESFVSPVPLYYRLKALLAQAGNPSQFISRNTFGQKYAIWNLALNIAAKLNGIPWTLDGENSFEPVDLYLGFSFSSIRHEKIGQSRNIAYVNIFDSNGSWKMYYSDGTVYSKFEERIAIFPRLASDAVQSAVSSPDKLKLIEVHYDKRFGKRERDAVVKGIRSVAPDASVLFVSITTSHPIRFFSQENAQFSAPRGSFFALTDKIGYLQTVEADRWSGHPKPLRLMVNAEHCLFPEDCRSVAKRILGLTRLNWRSVRDYSSLPVTILYSSLSARFTNYFSLTEWKNLNHQIKRIPWFI